MQVSCESSSMNDVIVSDEKDRVVSHEKGVARKNAPFQTSCLQGRANESTVPCVISVRNTNVDIDPLR